MDCISLSLQLLQLLGAGHTMARSLGCPGLTHTGTLVPLCASLDQGKDTIRLNVLCNGWSSRKCWL